MTTSERCFPILREHGRTPYRSEWFAHAAVTSPGSPDRHRTQSSPASGPRLTSRWPAATSASNSSVHNRLRSDPPTHENGESRPSSVVAIHKNSASSGRRVVMYMSPHWLDSIAEQAVDSPQSTTVDARACDATTSCSAIVPLLVNPKLMALARIPVPDESPIHGEGATVAIINDRRNRRSPNRRSHPNPAAPILLQSPASTRFSARLSVASTPNPFSN
jgi:hypothetical protein